jgi:hypothetical protein
MIIKEQREGREMVSSSRNGVNTHTKERAKKGPLWCWRKHLVPIHVVPTLQLLPQPAHTCRSHLPHPSSDMLALASSSRTPAPAAYQEERKFIMDPPRETMHYNIWFSTVVSW